MKLSLLSCAVLAAVVQARYTPQTPIQSKSHLEFPPLGFGTWNIKPDEASKAVSRAIEAGYRHIDCAAAYGNEKEVGLGIKEGLKKAGLKREDIWVTSKLWNDFHAGPVVQAGFEKTLSDLGLDYLDLYLMHWPVATINGKAIEDYVDTWHGLEALDTSKAHHVGVCNFSPKQLKTLIDLSATKPYAHQMELHPYLPQTEWIEFHMSHGIHVTAYSPFGNLNPSYSGKQGPPSLFENNVVVKIAEERNCTPATVALAWGMGRGTSVIPKSANPEHIKANLKKCELEYEDLIALKTLSTKNLTRFSNPSKRWGIDLFEGLEDV